ncbi:transcriptional regulator [Pedobacter sp. HMF7647]|uniref:Transcriptional regulator n=1 Tax=Hufsiella arboris TaxID=2695275 RepID=A0A7K1YEN9_9SPHI|nr:triple tyrosine motif-containing protein [Hufsiella arboris]MXV53052.1 transcriptional regulator [Hufsiella arboris]
MNKAFCAFVAVLLTLNLVYAADIQSIGVPYIENFSKSVYQAGNQNWSVVKDASGVIYYGNSQGLLSYDGRYWQLYKMPNHQIVRSVATDNHGKIYTGAFGEFGYWKNDKSGKFVYHSLISLIPKQYEIKDEVWKIYVDRERVLFQSFATIFIYEKGKITTVKAEQPFLFLFKAGSKYFVEVLSKGLYELHEGKLNLVANSSILGNTGILSVLPFGNRYLIGTAKSGLFIYDGATVKPWKTQADQFLKTFQLNNGSVILGKYFAFGTILNGIIILDQNGRIVQQINKSSGLQNNTVLSLYTDNNYNLWVGLDNGIDRVEINSPLYFYFDKVGQFGTVYSSIIHRNKIYIGTNQGLFYSDWNPDVNSFQTFRFNLIPNSQGQVWDLSLIDGQLICGHNDGTFNVNDKSFEKISSINGGWMITRLKSDPNLLVQGTYTGLVIYKKNSAGRWIFSHRIEGFTEPARYVEQDNKKQFWVSHAYRGIYKLTLTDDLRSIRTIRYYNRKNGLPDGYNINVFNLDGRVVFSSDNGFYVYDDLTDKFKPYQELNHLLGSFSVSNKIIPALNRKFWFIDHGKVALADFNDPEKPVVDSSQFTILNGRMVQYYENISRINPGLYLISVDDGFVIFNERSQSYSTIKLPKVLIRRVENTANQPELLSENFDSRQTIVLPYSKNSIRFTFSLPYYQKANIKFQYCLEGYSGGWSEWTTQTQKEFTNLSRGKYVFKVRAKINEGQISEVSIVNFNVDPPWFATIPAFIVYALLTVGLFFALRKLYSRNLAKHRDEIEQKLQVEQEEYRRREMQATERRIVELKNSQLEADIASKNREIANSAMSIVSKNELLEKLRHELNHLKDESGKHLSESQLKKIHKVIDEGMNDERDWNLFENSFNEAHENFFKKLKGSHPDLVPNDLKLCAYLRMNMSSKEMASLLNITVRGVEIRRYRLRKKLNIAHDKNLTEFLMEM